MDFEIRGTQLKDLKPGDVFGGKNELFMKVMICGCEPAYVNLRNGFVYTSNINKDVNEIYVGVVRDVKIVGRK